MASAAPDAISTGLMRITPIGRTLRHRNLDCVGRLRLRHRRQIDESADDNDEDDDEHQQAGHGGAFAERGSRCIAPSAYGSGKTSRPADRACRADGSWKVDGRTPP